MYQRKLAELDAYLERLNSVRASLLGKLGAALARQPGPCAVPAKAAPSTKEES